MANFHYRILVVDDDEDIRRSSAAVLARGGYEVRIADGGFEALTLMRQALPDLIITDLRMPNMSGFELLSVVRRRFPQIPVIVITGEFVGASNPEGLLADAFFHKGQYKPDELFKQIQLLLEQSPIRPYAAKPDKAPVWIPRNGHYIVVTCTECLRSSSVPDSDAGEGPHRLTCLYCGTQIRFIVEPRKTKSGGV